MGLIDGGRTLAVSLWTRDKPAGPRSVLMLLCKHRGSRAEVGYQEDKRGPHISCFVEAPLAQILFLSVSQKRRWHPCRQFPLNKQLTGGNQFI